MPTTRRRASAPSRIPALVVVGLALLTVAPTAAATDEADTPRETRAADRVLKLADGGALRGLTRMSDGLWELRDGDGWRSLPAGWVVSARDEDDLLREASSRRARARRGSLDERAAVAAWMLDEGLLTEAFGQLDGVLEDDPDHVGSRELLRRDDVRIALPAPAPRDAASDVRRAALEHLLVFGGDAPATLRELLLDRLAPEATGPGRDQLRATLVGELRSQRPGRRAFAALGLRRLFPTEPDIEVLRRALIDPAADVRRQASLAVRDSGDDGWVEACIASLSHGSSTVRTHAAEALGTMLEPAAVEPLVAYYVALSEAGKAGGGGGGARAMAFFGTQRAFVQGFNANVAAQAAIADPIIGTLQEGASLDARVLATSGGGALNTEKAAARGALQRITGADPGRSSQAWTRWWQRHGDEWRAQLPSPAAAVDVEPAATSTATDTW